MSELSWGENDAAHVVTVVYDFQDRGLHSCLRCHYDSDPPWLAELCAEVECP